MNILFKNFWFFIQFDGIVKDKVNFGGDLKLFYIYMVSNRIQNIKKEVIEWAIQRAGYDLDEYYSANPNVKEWANGQKWPTIKQLERFTQKVHVPFGYMFFDEPPHEEIPIPFFRSGSTSPKADSISLNVLHTIQILQERQSWLVDYLNEADYDDLDFVGKFDVDTPYQTIVQDIRQVLGLSNNWASKFNTWEETLNYLTIQIEEIGIIVTFNGIVGNNTKRKIDPQDCRGFVLVNKKAPFLFINASDAKAAQLFTLIHELAHVWIGETAGFDHRKMMPANHPIEILCDKIAAEFLVPANFLIEKWKENKDFKYLGKIFKVSQIVIARRLMDLSLITKSDFFRFYYAYMENWRKNKEDKKTSGGDFYATAKKRISLRFAGFVNTAVKENSLLYRDAYKLTTLKGDTYDKFMNEYLFQT